MKYFLTLLFLVLTVTEVSPNQKPDELKTAPMVQQQKTWNEVEVVYESSRIEGLTPGEKMTHTINTSLNFGSKEKIERDCLNALKKEAADKGYFLIFVDQHDSKTKRYNKRGIEVTLVAYGYRE